jgi:hypothetical protein
MTEFLLTSICILGSIAVIVYLFIWFHMCSNTVAIVIVTLFFIAIWLMIAALQVRKDSVLFTSAFMSLYIAYLCWDALTQDMNQTCNTFLKSNANTWAQEWIGLFFTFFGLIGAALFNRQSMNV